MLIKPEKMLRFKIIVPEEYEYELLDSLISLGAIHLKPLTQGTTHLPLLLQLVYENRLPIEKIDINEAYKIVTRSTYKDDILYQEMEKIYREYKEISYYREIVSKLVDLDMSPLVFKKVFKKLVFQWFFIDKKVLPIVVSEARKNRSVAKYFLLSTGEAVIIFIYNRDIIEKMQTIIEKYDLKEVALPEWMYTSTDFLFSSMDRRVRELKRKTYDILSELASLLTSSFEYEQASRVQLLELALNACRDISNNIKLAEEILEEAIVIKLTRKILETKNIETLEKIGMNKKILEIARKLVENSFLDKEFVEKLTKKEYYRFYPSVCNDIIDETKNIEKLEAMDKILSSYFKKLKNINFLKRRIGDIEISVYVGNKKYLKEIMNETINMNAAMETIELSHEEVAILLAHKDVLRHEVRNLMKRYKMEEVDITPYLYENIEKSIEKIRQDKTEKIEKIRLLLLFLIIDYYVKKKKIIIDDPTYIRLLRKLENLRLRKIESKTIPPKSRFKIIKKITDETEKILKTLKENYDILVNIGKDPNVEKIYLDEEHMLSIINEFVEVGKNVLCLEPFLESLLNAQSRIQGLTLLHNRRVFIADGWIPEHYVGSLEKTVTSKIPRIIYFKVRDLVIGEEAPTLLTKKGFLKYFIPLTLLRGVPNYWEIDPTPIFTILFLTMYGLMFGDIGLGTLIALAGLWLYKTKTKIFGISRETAETLGVMSTAAGISSIIFGFLYGIAFLVNVLPFRVLKPVHDVYMIMSIALVFGIIQLIIGMLINIINDISEGNHLHAVFGGTGLAGIVYYIAGVFLVYKLIQSGYNLSVFSSIETLPLEIIIFVMLLVVFGFSVYKFIKYNDTEQLTEGIVEVLEMIIAYPANSLSYIRLAAFAIAHEVFGILALELGKIISPIISYIFTNLLVLSIEALAVGIQSLRLVFYEFSTKFFRGEGKLFIPVSSVASEISQK